MKVQSGKPEVASKAADQVVKVKAKPVKAVAQAKSAKVKEKDSVKTTISKTAPTVSEAPKLKRAPPPAAPVKIVVMGGVPVKSAVVVAPVAPVSVPARAGRPSSRLAQLTVPSMAQSVASTAAKASYSQITNSAPIAPQLASAIKKDLALVNNWKLKPVEQLNEAEVIAMPDDEYMNETQMAFFKLKLSKLKQDILSNAGETTEHLREETAVVPDPADRATIEEEHALELRTRDRERKLLKKIEQSMARIDSGDYGYCDETGEPIGVGRLLARPTANLSLEAQQRRELKQRMFGD
jgi:DnaK suppressor protein